MPKIWLSLGTNLERQKHLSLALERLEEQLGHAITSPVYETRAEGFNGPNFYNMVAGYDSEMELEKLLKTISQIEQDLGRIQKERQFNSRTIDIDVLIYDEFIGEFASKHLPREDIIQYAFVLKPLADVAPNDLHPELQKSYQQLWQAFTEKPEMTPVSFSP